MRALLDTHMWVWWLIGGDRLSAAERSALDRAGGRGELCLAAISLWEAKMLHTRGRLTLGLPFGEWLVRAAAPAVVTLLPLDVEVIGALDDLPARFQGDPADRLIVATARTHSLPLASHDVAIRRSRLVTIWKPGTTS